MQDAHQPATQAIAEEKFDTRAFVFACLEENPDLKLAEIEQLAFSSRSGTFTANHQPLSQAIFCQE